MSKLRTGAKAVAAMNRWRATVVKMVSRADLRDNKVGPMPEPEKDAFQKQDTESDKNQEKT